MKITLALAAPALLGAFLWTPQAASQPGPQDPPAKGVQAHGVSSEIFIIRYDPSTIFLTYELVAPLCNSEVRSNDKDAPVVLGQMRLVPMASNESQPNGVFVGRLQIEWTEGLHPIDAESRAHLMHGINMLSAHLSERLFENRVAESLGQIKEARRLVSQLADDHLRISKDLARAEHQTIQAGNLSDLSRQLLTQRFEREEAQRSLVEMIQGLEALSGAAKATREKLVIAEAQAQRTKLRYDGGDASNADLHESKLALAEAKAELNRAEAEITTREAELARRSERFELREAAVKSLETQVAELTAALGRKGSAPQQSLEALDRLLSREHRRDMTAADLLSVRARLRELQRVHSSLTDVHVEVW